MNEQPPKQVERLDLFDRQWIRVGLFVIIPIAVFILVSAGIRVSQYGMDHTIVVLGQHKLQIGSPAAVRITLIADGEGFLRPDQIIGKLVKDNHRAEIFRGVSNIAGYAIGENFTVPDLSPGPAVLELEVFFHDQKRTVRADVELVDTLQNKALFIPDDVKPRPDPVKINNDLCTLQVFTEDRGAPTGFTSALFFRTLDGDDKPISMQVEIKEPGIGAERKKISTDRMGLAALPMKPLDLDYPVEIITGEAPLLTVDNIIDSGVPAPKVYLFPQVIYGGIHALVQNPIANFNYPIQVNIHQLTGGGAFYVDLFQGDKWIQTYSTWSDGDGTATIQIVPPVKGLVRLQITNSSLSPGKTVAVRHVFITDEAEDLNDGLRAVLKLMSGEDKSWANKVSRMFIEGGTGFDRRMTAAFALSRLYKGHRAIERIISSRKEDDRELGIFKARVQRGIMLIIILLGFAVALLIGLIARQAQLRQARLTMMIMSENNDSDEKIPIDPEAAKLNRNMIFQGIILLLIVVGAFASIALLIDVMKWGTL